MAEYVCTVAGGKGGVGRTTTALNMGVLLESEGYDTVVVDADLAMANVGGMLGVEPNRTLHDVLAGDAAVADALTEASGGLSVLAGGRRLEAYADAEPAELGTVIGTVRTEFDVVLIDTSAGIDHETSVALGVADGVILVTTPTDVAVRDTRKIAQLAERVDGNLVGVVVTHCRDSADVTEVRERLEPPVLGGIPYDETVADDRLVVADGQTGPATESYRELTPSLFPVFFEGADPDDLDPVFDEAWLDDQDTAHDTDSEDTDGSDDDGVLGLFN